MVKTVIHIQVIYNLEISVIVLHVAARLLSENCN